MSKLVTWIPIATVIVLCGLLTYVGSEALAAGPTCNDSRGSTLARHARLACKSVSRFALREHPRWANHVALECRTASSSRSWCTWEVTWNAHNAHCSGDLSVVGIAHPRVHYGKRVCVA